MDNQAETVSLNDGSNPPPPPAEDPMQALDRLLNQSYQFPSSFEAMMMDPLIMLVVCLISLVISLTIIAIRFCHLRKKSKKKSTTPPQLRPPEIAIPPMVPVLEREEPPQPKNTESVNTEIDLDEFMNRLFGSGIVVRRHKPGEVKVRCLKFNDQCDLCVFKQFRKRNSIVQPSGGPYMRLSLKNLKDCFECEGANPPSFILDFKEKTLQLSAEFALDNAYLVQGFKGVCRKAKQDAQFLSTWSQRFTQRLTSAKNIRRGPQSSRDTGGKSRFFLFSSPGKSSVGEEDEIRSVTTINTMVSR